MTTGRGSRAEPDGARRAVLRAGLGAAALAPALQGCHRRPFFSTPPVSLHLPGRDAGHVLRERWRAGGPAPSDWKTGAAAKVGVAIVGSGAAGLGCAWRLARAGHRDHVVLAGPEWLGNAASTSLAGTGCPTGAHYLPLPSTESRHVRELLADAGVLLDGVADDAPTYDERVLVHAPSHRVLAGGRWEPGSLPALARDAEARTQGDRFLALVERLSHERGADGRRAFVVPASESSTAASSRELDRLDAAAWLDREGFVAPTLRAWLAYCTRDEFGATPDEVSAWALAHYFASRRGRARNAEPGAVLTWPEGLAPLARHLAAGALEAGRVLPVSVERVERTGDGARLFGWRAPAAGGAPEPVVLHARRVVVAAPLAVAARLVPEVGAAWPELAAPPRRAPWTIANVAFRRPPVERETGGEDELAWDNVVHGSDALGFVHARHQAITIDPGGPTVLTAYRAFAPADRDARDALGRLLADEAPAPDARAWLDLVGVDLERAYGARVWRDVSRVQVTVRGHGMAAPAPGFLADPRLRALRAGDGPVLFAHSDLSGYSVFEEALWWGTLAAERIAG
jgi:phytoene dehydrogenase-like protein